MAFTGHENHTIPTADGAALTKEFRKRFSTQPKGYFFSKDTLQSMLDTTNSVGIRFYFGSDTDGKLKLVFCACAANENDIYGDIVGDGGNICPPACGVANSLNS
jgi:hypothetical protein